jgi:hypothetical protein
LIPGASEGIALGASIVPDYKAMGSGYFTISRWQGVPVRVHWTLPLFLLYFSNWTFAPVYWGAFFVLVLLHELGHAILVRMFHQHVFSIDVTGFGGLCRWAGTVTAIQRSVIAWGGVLMQAALFVAAKVWTMVSPPETYVGWQLADVFTRTNLWIMGFNLIPIAPLDGAEAWSLIPLLRARQRTRSAFRDPPPPPPPPPPPRPSTAGAPDRSEDDVKPADPDANFKRVLNDVLSVEKPDEKE